MDFGQIEAEFLAKLQNGEISASIDGQTAIFYSGTNPATNVHNGAEAAACQKEYSGNSYRVEDTQAGAYITTLVNDGAVTADQANSLWTDASTFFAQQASGDVIAFVNGASPERVFAKVELPALLDNPKVTSINGIPTSDLTSLSTNAALQLLGPASSCFGDNLPPPSASAPVTDPFPDTGGAPVVPTPHTGTTLGVDFSTALGILGLGVVALGAIGTLQPEVAVPAIAALILLSSSGKASATSNVDAAGFKAETDAQPDAAPIAYAVAAIGVAEGELPASDLAQFAAANISIDGLGAIATSASSPSSVTLIDGSTINIGLSQIGSNDFQLNLSGDGKDEVVPSAFIGANIQVGGNGATIDGTGGQNLLIGLGDGDTLISGPGNVLLATGDHETFEGLANATIPTTATWQTMIATCAGPSGDADDTFQALSGSNIMIGGKGTNNFFIQSYSNYEQAAGAQTPYGTSGPQNVNVIWGGGGTSNYDFSGVANNVEIIYMDNPSISLVEQVAATLLMRQNPSTMPTETTFIVDPSPKDTISFDNVQANPVSYQLLSSYDDGSGGTYKTYGYEDAQGRPASPYHLPNDPADPANHFSIYSASYAEQLNVSGLLNGQFGISVNGNGPSFTSRYETDGPLLDPSYLANTFQYHIRTGSDGSTLSGGNGNMFLDGSGSTTFDVGAGDGLVDVSDKPSSAQDGGGVIAFDASFSQQNLSVWTGGAGSQDLVLENPSGDGVEILNALSDAVPPISEVTFSDGSSLTFNQIIADLEATGGSPTIAGTVAGQSTTDLNADQPFATMTIGDVDAFQTETVTVTPSSTQNGVLSDPNAAADGSSVVDGAYTVTGSATVVTAALDGLVFTPTPHQVAPGQTVTTGFTIAVTDGAGATASDSTTTLVATAVNDPPVIGGTAAGQTTTDDAPIQPFTTATIADVDTGVQDSLTITLENAGGTATDDNGTLSGNGLSKTGTGTYNFAATTPAALTSELQSVIFTPTMHQVAAGQTVTTSFALTASQAASGVATVLASDTATSLIVTALNH